MEKLYYHLVCNVAQLLSLFYSGAICGMLGLKAIPEFGNLLQYGKTLHVDSKQNSLSAYVAQYSVPKSWFAHFYIVYYLYCLGIGFILIIGLKLNIKGKPFFLEQFMSASTSHPLTDTVSKIHRRKLAFILLYIQAGRRLIETVYVTRFSPRAKMNVLHYAMGLIFYLGLCLNCFLSLVFFYTSADASWQDQIRMWSTTFGWTEVSLVAFFLILQVDQFQNHRHLASLQKYSLPTFRFFKYVSCAHYMDEVLIYGTIALIVNRKLQNLDVFDINYFLAFLFVFVNLAISSRETHKFYRSKFNSFRTPFSIVPFII